MKKFDAERFLKSAPLVSCILPIAMIVTSLVVSFPTYTTVGPAQLSLQWPKVIESREYWRAVTSFLLAPGEVLRHVTLAIVGANLGSWFVISASKGKWEFILMNFWWNYVILLSSLYF